MSSNPSLYRYVDFIGGNILDASNVTLLQTILEGRSASAVNGITGMAQLFAQGTLLNCVFNITGSTIVMTHANASYPIFVLVNDRFESLGNTVTIAGSQPGSGIVNLYLNWAWNQVTSATDPSFLDGITGEPTIQAGQLALDVDWADTHGSPSPTQFAINSSPIVLAIFNMSATPNVTVTYINGVLPYAQGNPNQAGLVALTDDSGLAVGSTDPRLSDERVPAPGSVYSSSVAGLLVTGLKSSGYPAWLPGLAAPGAQVVDSAGNLETCIGTVITAQAVVPWIPADIPATLVTDLYYNNVPGGPAWGWNPVIGNLTLQIISNNVGSALWWAWRNGGPAGVPAYSPTAFVAFTLTGVTVSGNSAIYAGAITGTIGSEPITGAGNALAGLRFTIAGFTNPGNNGIELLCTASTATSLTLTNQYAVPEGPGTYTATLNQGGITSDDLIYSTQSQTVTQALDALNAGLAGSGTVKSVFGRTGIVVAQAGDYTASQVGAAPASHVGLQLGLPASHPASVTSNTGGFTVNEGVGALSGDAVALLDSSSARKAALTHTGDIYSLLANAANAQGKDGSGTSPAVYRGTLGLMSLIANVLAEHVNYNSHGSNNPHNLDAADIGAASETYVNTTVAGIISDVTAYTDAKTNISIRIVTTPGPTFPNDLINPAGGTVTGQPGLPHNAPGQAAIAYPSTSASITYVIVNFGGFFEIAFGNGVYAGTQQVALPEATGWSGTNFYASASLSFAMNITYDTKGNYYEAVVNDSTRIVKVIGTADDSHNYVWNGIAAVTAIAWRNLTANALIISAFDTTTQTFNQGSVGNAVQIQGRNFGSSGTLSFNGHAASISGYSSTSITCTIPAGATTGNITVTPTGGTSVNSPFVFTIV